ncbi:UDP-glycosyltransferase 86A2 isoform X2 [Malania oleifera]|uniref:UDP-glycosyltransferase 86A2 isoform X2 n=1 Tax=Malania oleifera TaxID=397392 RepID=UPI0025AE5516|nr:UDP-glycosyltransferase 86A2 isoform X2 [Malania oleifera]
MADGEQKPHAILVAYPLQGHVIPSVHLAIKLASKGFTITFVNTNYIHHQTFQAHRSRDSACSDPFAAVRDSGLDIRYTTVCDGLPLEFDRSLNHDQFMGSLLHVFSTHVEEVLGRIISSACPPVTCLIADTFFVWPATIAQKFGLLYVSFWTEPALVFTLYYHMHLLEKNGHFACPDPRGDTVDYVPGVAGIEPKDMTSYLQDTDTSSVCHQIISKAFQEARGAHVVLCNTVHELEPYTISALRPGIQFLAVGPIFPTGFSRSAVATSLWSESDCTHWLDARPRASVLYVSFGSYAHVTKSDLVEIANGLARSGVSFVWVLRPDIVSSEDADPLPVGYREEIGDRAMVIPWCFQISVLAHPAIGGFLTHCGWNSILESAWCRVPMLCFPLLTDQFTNRKLVVDDWKIGINLSDGKPITKEEVSENVIRLMSGKSGDEFRNRIGEMRTMMEAALTPGGSSEKNMDRFIAGLKASTQK